MIDRFRNRLPGDFEERAPGLIQRVFSGAILFYGLKLAVIIAVLFWAGPWLADVADGMVDRFDFVIGFTQ